MTRRVLDVRGHRVGLEVAPDATAACRAAAALVVRRARRAVRTRGRFDVALAGGTTPLGIYEALGRGRVAAAPVWEATHVYWGDERVVAADSPHSNSGTAWRAGLSALRVPPGNVHAVPVASGDAGRAAAAYEAVLRGQFHGSAWPRFDLVLLGLGPDGHTASLLPGSPALDETARWTAPVHGGSPSLPRVTLTIPVLEHAAALAFVVSGTAKAPTVARWLGPDPADDLPAGRLRPRGEWLVFADAAATARLDLPEFRPPPC